MLTLNHLQLFKNKEYKEHNMFNIYSASYGRYYEMPQKECERYIFRVMAYMHFYIPFQNQIGKLRRFKQNKHKIVGHLKKHVINFRT